MLPFRTQMDYSMLIYTSFYLGNPFNSPKSTTRPELLSLYFASRRMRSIFYLGCAIKLGWELGVDWSLWKLSSIIPIGLLAWTSALNLKWTTNTTANNIGDWSTVASEGKGLIGSWWMGAGNGDWFAFVGHNGSEELTIIPSSLLDQMSVKRDKGTVILEEHVD